MAGLQTAAAVVGIADVTFRGISALYDFLGKMKKAPEEIARLTRETGALERALTTLKQLQVGSLDPDVRDRLKHIGLADAVVNCDKACQELVSKLKIWNARGDEHFISRFQTAIHEKAIQRYTATIADCKGTAQLAVSTATLCIIVQTPSPGYENEKRIQELHSEIVQLQREAKAARGSAERELRLYQDHMDDPRDPSTTERETTRNIDLCREAAEKYWASCAVAATVIRNSRGVQQTIQDVISGNDAVVWVGMPESVAQLVNRQGIGTVRSAEGAKVRVGIMKW